MEHRSATTPHSAPCISHSEWRWVAVTTLLILALTQVPPTVARVLGPKDRVHVGTYWYAHDFSQYLAAMREGASSSSWLIHDHLSAEPHEPVLMYPLYVAIGKLAGAAGLPLLAVYGAVELATRVLLPVSLYLFVATLLPDISARRLAFLFAAFASGIGLGLGIGAALVQPSSGSVAPLNTFVEALTFGAFLAAPHLGLGMAATLCAIAWFAAACRGSSTALALLAADVLALSLIHPFNLPVLLGVFAVYAGAQSVADRRVALRPLAACAIAGIVGAPLLLYNFVTFSFTPFWSATYGAQNVMPSPRPWELPVDYGIVFVLALLGAAGLRARRTPAQTILLVWVAVSLLAMYAPVPYQRRFAFGIQPALAVLAALGWGVAQRGAIALLTRLRAPEQLRVGAARRVILYPVAFLAFTSTVGSYLAVVIYAASNQPEHLYTVDRDTYAIGQWIAERSGADDVVLGSWETGNALAGVIPGRVVLGYEVATLHARDKKAAVETLYRGELPDAAVAAFLAENRVSYLIFGPEERRLGPYDPGLANGLPLVQTIGNTRAYTLPVE